VGDGVLTNDSDDDAGDVLTVVIVDLPQHGTLDMNPDGSFTYTPDEDFHGEDSFTYRATDGIAESNLATVTITVNPVNDAPVAGDDFYETDQDTELVVDAASGVLANDFDPDGDELSVVVVTGPLNGILVLETDGSFTYTPNEGFFGSDSFVYEVTDGFLSAQATVTITVHEIGEGEAPSDAALLAVLSEDDDGVSSSSDDDWTTATDAVLTDLAN
jgi:large repetitive protein